MAIKPTEGHIDWITDDDTNKYIAPSAGKRLQGWIAVEKPPFQYFNWAWRLIDRWLKWAEAQSDENVAAIAANAQDISDEATARAAADSTHAALTDPHGATSAATAGRIMLRDASGRAQVAAPGAATDCARKQEVDDEAAARAAADSAHHAQEVGTIFFVPASSAPAGSIKANGPLLSRTTYVDLWTYAQASGNIVDDATWQAEAAAGGCAKFSTGDGSTTFRIPEIRGEFVRGWDDGRGIDSGRGIGSWQADANKAHTHTKGVNIQYGSSPGGDVHYLASGAAIATGSSGGSESRPRNIALLACIKY